MTPPYHSGDGFAIYHGKAEEIIPSLDREFGLVYLDPPYGLEKAWKRRWHGNNGNTRLWGEIPLWDGEIIPMETLGLCISKGNGAIVWGGNYYALPPSRCWFVWDKLQSDRGGGLRVGVDKLGPATKGFPHEPHRRLLQQGPIQEGAWRGKTRAACCILHRENQGGFPP